MESAIERGPLSPEQRAAKEASYETAEIQQARSECNKLNTMCGTIADAMKANNITLVRRDELNEIYNYLAEQRVRAELRFEKLSNARNE